MAVTKIGIHNKINKLLERGCEIEKKERHPDTRGFAISYVSGPLFETWMNEINILNDRYLEDHPLHDSIHNTFFHRRNRPSAFEDMMNNA